MYNNNRYYFRKNIQGDVTHVYDANGILEARYVYDAWGNHKIYDGTGHDVTDGTFTHVSGIYAGEDCYCGEVYAESGQTTDYTTHISHINPIRYRGYYYDKETSLYYLQSRYYDPEIGRFLNADSIEYLDPESINGLNLYAYCGNNAVMNVDSYGTSPQNVLTAFERIFVGLSELCRYLVKNAPKYKTGITKIGGYGARAEYRANLKAYNQTKSLGKTLGKVATVLAVATLAINIGQSLYSNIKNGASLGVIVSDVVDIGARFAISWGITALFSAMLPGVGFLVGIGVSMAVDWMITNMGGVVNAFKEVGKVLSQNFNNVVSSIGKGINNVASSVSSAWNRFWSFSWI